MPKEEWGVKRLCPHCANRFYDLNKDPMTCPVCANSFSLESLTAARGRTLVSSKTSAAKADEPVIEEEEDLDADTNDVELDDDLLEEDDDDDNVSLDEIADVSTEDKDDN
ncbi:TIGR02300 family protein [uncultured Thioclava sp.]|uniref:TIGR02300 family protein n=1 Tax=Thioclava arctica TaxID=3238301 RepID=A0ABV3TEH0_9RHOB|nr:TIGR02300 family protein [uncultured Thioclava sp.]